MHGQKYYIKTKVNTLNWGRKNAETLKLTCRMHAEESGELRAIVFSIVFSKAWSRRFCSEFRLSANGKALRNAHEAAAQTSDDAPSAQILLFDKQSALISIVLCRRLPDCSSLFAAVLQKLLILLNLLPFLFIRGRQVIPVASALIEVLLAEAGAVAGTKVTSAADRVLTQVFCRPAEENDGNICQMLTAFQHNQRLLLKLPFRGNYWTQPLSHWLQVCECVHVWVSACMCECVCIYFFYSWPNISHIRL